MSKLPSEGLFRSFLGAFWLNKYSQLIESETAADRHKRINAAITDAEIQAFKTGNSEDRDRVKQLRLLATTTIAFEDASAAGDLPKIEQLDSDFREHFRSKAENITSEDMRAFLAKLLATELTKPGTMSKRSVSIVADMDRNDAETIVNLCKFRWVVNGLPELIVLDINDNLYGDQGVDLDAVNGMESFGLLTSIMPSGYNKEFLGPGSLQAVYYSRAVIVRADVKGKKMAMGGVMLSAIGRQIFGLIDSNPVPGYFDKCAKTWREAGLTVG